MRRDSANRRWSNESQVVVLFGGFGSNWIGVQMNGIRILAACVIVTSAVPSLLGQEVLTPPATDSLFRETVSRLGNVHMSAHQIAQVKELAARFGPEIEQAERKAGESEAQKHARDNAIARAIEMGLRGARARELLKSATSRSDEERAAFQRATRLRQEFDQAVIDLLTESQRSEIQRPARRVDSRSEFLIVQLSPSLRLPPKSTATLDDAAAALDLPRLRKVIAQYGLSQSERAVKAELLDRLDDANNKSTGSEIRLLRTFWQIDIRTMKRLDVESALRSLNDLEEVEHAYAALGLEEPATSFHVNPSDDPYNFLQGYLDPAPLGIDARASWSVNWGQGAGVGLVDLERGWNIDHEDLDAFLEKPLYGQRLPGNDHGTSVLGEIVAEDNSVGIVGAAPGVDYVALTSRYHAVSGLSEPHIANAVTAALFFMDPGDVLLLEAQTETGFPVEIEPLNYIAIRLAVASRIIVIEPSGNGNHNLDAFHYLGRPILNRHASYFRDSGAIMVGASDPANAHNKAGASSYGSRVDCFGWGNHVTTTSCSNVPDILDNGGGNDNKSYRAKFNGTSSAAPIVAGAALLVQGLWKAKYGAALTSAEMREILSDPLTGTAQGSSVPGHIGVMPNLKAIIAAKGFGEAALTPDPGFAGQIHQCRLCCRTPHRRAFRQAHARCR